MHIGICAGGCNAADGPKDKQDVDLFFSDSLTAQAVGQAGCKGIHIHAPGQGRPDIGDGIADGKGQL